VGDYVILIVQDYWKPISHSLFIWFPAAWMPLIVDAIKEKSYMHIESTRQLGAVAFTDQLQSVLTGV